MCPEKDRKIEDEHINQPQFVEQKKHPRKLTNAIEAECYPRAKNENANTFEHAQKEHPGTEKGGIPAKLQNRKQNE